MIDAVQKAPVRQSRPVYLRCGFFGRSLAAALLAGAALMPFAISGTAQAQEFLDILNNENQATQTTDDDRLLLDADTLTFDQTRNIVTVTGDVQAFFGGNSLEADRLTYDQNAGILTATGRVRLIEANGNVIRSEEITLSEDFKDAFVSALQIDSTDDTFFAATSGTRVDGNRIILTNGVYNVCGACQTSPDRIPTWRIKAEEIIIDDTKQRISYKNASFELLGIPVAYLPRFSHIDPRVKQKSGVLVPTFRNDSDLGFVTGLPLYYAFSKSADVTFTPTYSTLQGFLGVVEARQRLSNGVHTLQLAGIRQDNPDEFFGEPGDRDLRGGLRTTGSLQLSEQWDAGWDILALSDRTFAEDYEILTNRVDQFTSNVFLTGLSDSRYFDARGLFFNILDADTPETGNLQNQQAVVHPVIDYDGIVDNAIAGGQLSFTGNITSLSRLDEEITVLNGESFLDGASGTQGRVSGEVEWKRQIVTRGGHIITPSLALRADTQAFTRANDPLFAGLPEDDLRARGQVTGGLEWRYPILIKQGRSSHIIEPIAQLFISPDETQADRFLNEDSQTVSFDDTNIFQRDRFAGFDRVEGGTRANIGLTYQGQLTNWLEADALIGESFHLAGQNSFADQGVASVYFDNGLETDRSDIVTRIGLTAMDRFGLSARGRFDEDEVELNRADFEARFTNERLQTVAGYTLIREQPLDELERSSQIFGAFNLRTHRYVSFFGDGRYDLDDSRVVNNRIGVVFDDNQIRASFAFRQDFDEDGSRDGEGIEFTVNFRTLGGL